MTFASRELAARIEAADCSILTGSVASMQERRPEESSFCTPIAGGVASYTGPGSPLNKIAGLGFDELPSASELDEIEAAFAERGCPVQVDLASLANPATGALLCERGYVLRSFENVLGRALPIEPTSKAMQVEVEEVEEVEEAEFELWLDTVALGFSVPDTQGVPSHESFSREVLQRVIGDMVAAGGFRLYLARLHGELAGAGTLRLHEEVAQLCGASTLPTQRLRGVQTALLERRLLEAGTAGSNIAVVTTQPGSKSQENVQKQGFGILYTRAVFELVN